jgi:hypothetical protein
MHYSILFVFFNSFDNTSNRLISSIHSMNAIDCNLRTQSGSCYFTNCIPQYLSPVELVLVFSPFFSSKLTCWLVAIEATCPLLPDEMQCSWSHSKYCLAWGLNDPCRSHGNPLEVLIGDPVVLLHQGPDLIPVFLILEPELFYVCFGLSQLHFDRRQLISGPSSSSFLPCSHFFS